MRKILYKKVFSLTLLVCVCFNLFGCIKVGPFTYEKDGVTYKKTSIGWDVIAIDDSACPEVTSIYVLDEIKGKNVNRIGSNSPVYSTFRISVNLECAERVYFPWSVIVSDPDSHQWYFTDDNLQYVISASTKVFVDYSSNGHKYVVPHFVYIKAEMGEIRIDKDAFCEFYIPANIAYFFNYPDNPNEGYFFVDILETTGKLVQPPYEPKREGYVFSGWYKDESCTSPWNFEKDTVNINYDENGERIYEEIRLYAKWTEN